MLFWFVLTCFPRLLHKIFQQETLNGIYGSSRVYTSIFEWSESLIQKSLVSFWMWFLRPLLGLSLAFSEISLTSVDPLCVCCRSGLQRFCSLLFHHQDQRPLRVWLRQEKLRWLTVWGCRVHHDGEGFEAGGTTVEGACGWGFSSPHSLQTRKQREE